MIEGDWRLINSNKVYKRVEYPDIYNCLYKTKSGKFIEFTNYHNYGRKAEYNLLSNEIVVEWFNDNEVLDEYPNLEGIESKMKL